MSILDLRLHRISIVSLPKIDQKSTLSIISLAVAMFVSLILFWQQVTSHSTYEYFWSRIPNDDIYLKMGFSVDPLTLIVSILVTTVGISVMIYSDSYMRHD